MLIEEGYDVYCEPNINYHDKYKLIDVDKALNEFDVVALLVNHKQFSSEEFINTFKSQGFLNFCSK